jgi:hypothetical protein
MFGVLAVLTRADHRVNAPIPAALSLMSWVTCSHRVAATTGSESTDAAIVAACWFIISSLSDKGFIATHLVPP